MATIEKYQTASGATLYRVRYRTPDHRSTQKRGFTTKRDAEMFAATVEVAKMRGEYVVADGRQDDDRRTRPARGFSVSAAMRNRRASGRTEAPGMCTSHRAGPTRRIADIRRSDVAAWVADLSRQPRPGHRSDGLHSAQTDSRRCRGRPDAGVQSGARGEAAETGSAAQRCILTADQLQRLADESGRYRSLVLLLGVGGLRWGEAAALRPRDVDFLRRRVELHRNAVHGGCRDRWSAHSSPTRTAPWCCRAFVTDALAQTTEGKGRDELLWPSRIGGYLAPPSSAAFVAGRCGAPLPERRPGLPAGDGALAAPYGGVAGHLGGRQSESGAAHAGPRQRGDDVGCVRRTVRLGSGRRSPKVWPNCGHGMRDRASSGLNNVSD